MSNDTLRSEIISLERKVKLLLSEHSHLKNEVESIRRENDSLKNLLDQKESNLVHFQNQMKISKIVESMVVGERNTIELKEVIDDYIKEIDKCIAHLGEA